MVENGSVDVKVEEPEVHSTTGEDGQPVESEPSSVKEEATNGGGKETTTPLVTEEPPSELEKNIIRQIEYYFGDINLPRDNFLKEQTQIDDGWVPLDTMLKFNRLNKLTKESKVIVDALKKSKSGLMHISEDGSKIRRDPDRTLKVVNFKEMNARTLYMKGFPKTASVDEVLGFFYGLPFETENINYRRERSGESKGEFKGSVFVAFKSDREAMDYLSKIKNGEKLCYDGVELEICSKEEYYAKKVAERNKGKPNKASQPNKEQREQKKFDYEKCGVLKLFNIDPNSSRESLKTVFRSYAQDLFISYEKGSTSAFLRFVDEETAKNVLVKATEDGKKLATPEGEFNAELISEAEEKEKAIEKLKQDEVEFFARQNNSGRRGGGGGGGRGGHRGGRGGGGGNRNPFSKNRGGKRDHHQVSSEAKNTDNDGVPVAKHSKFDSDQE